MATCSTPQFGNSYCPQVSLSVWVTSSTATSVTYSWSLNWVTYGFYVSGGENRLVTASIDGTQVCSTYINMNGRSSFTIATGTHTVRKTSSSRSISISCTCDFRITWSGTYGGSKSGSSSLTVPAISAYTVTFQLNGGTRTGGGALTQTVNAGGSATAPTCSKAGYTLKGWDKALSPINSNTTITAQWELNPMYTVTFNTNGGTFGTSSLTFRSGVGVSIPKTKPTKSITLSYDFVCSAFTSKNKSETRSLTFTSWNTEENGSGTSYSPGATIDGSSNITLYAQYSGVKPNLPTLDSSKATLSGWFTKSSGGKQITSSSNLTSTQTIYAQYSSYVVTLHANGGVITLDGSTDDPVSSVDLVKTHGTALTIPDYTAYETSSETDTSSSEFKGWSTVMTGPTVEYTKGGTYTANSPATLYAVYGTLQHIVKWSVGYGTNPIIKTETVNHGASATPPKDPTRDGYAFAGWLGEYKSVKTDRTILALWASTPIWIWNGETWIGYEPEEG